MNAWRARARGGVQARMAHQLADDLPRHLVLHLERRVDGAVVALRPARRAVAGVDQLHTDAGTLCVTGHAAAQHEVGAQRAAELGHIVRVAVTEADLPGQHRHVPEARDRGDDVLRQAVAERALTGVAGRLQR